MRLESPTWRTSSRTPKSSTFRSFPGDTIKFGATVTLIDDDTGEKRIWQIVGEPEANPSEGKISVTSPIARALIGKAKGTTVLVDAPGGTKAYKVRHVEWLGDKQKKRKQF